MDTFKKPERVPPRKTVKGSQQDTHYCARLESSVTSASPSTSLCSQQSKCDNYSYAASFYKSVINNSTLSNDSRVLHDSSQLHSSVKKFGETMWLELINTVSKKVVFFERWWCVLTDELDLCIQGFVENKSGMVQTEPIIKRMDSHTVACRNYLCKLKNFSDEDCVSGLPHFIKNRFACGFPEDWKLLRRQWTMFLKAGEPQDFQWKGNDNAAILDNCSSIQKPPGQSSQESSCEEFTNKTQKRNSLLTNNKFTERVLGLGSNNAVVEKRDTKNTGNRPCLEEERTNCEPQDFQWKGNDNAAILDNCSSIQKPPGQSSQESSCEEFTNKTQKRNSLLANNKFTERVLGLGSNNAVVEKRDTKNTGNRPCLEEERTNCAIPKRNKPECSNTATTTKKHFLATKRSFDIVNDSENSSDEDNGIVNLGTNCQDAKINDNQYGNKEQSVVVRRNNTPQALVGNEVLLEKWLPVLKGRQLCFKGVRSTGSTYNDHTTAAVKSRLKSDTVTLVDGSTCKLIGQLHDVQNCLPAEIGSKFKCGMPLHWRKALEIWITYANIAKGTSATRSESPYLNNQQQGNVKTSSRGRILLRPVKHWLGETPSSVINCMADNNKEKNNDVREKLWNDQGSNALPAVKSDRVQSAGYKKKCEMLNKPEAVPPKSVKNAVNSTRKKELVYRNVNKSKKEQQPSIPDTDKVVNSDPLDGNNCPENQFENPIHFTNSERRVLKSGNKQINAQKESSNAIMYKNKSDGVGKNEVSHSIHSINKINYGNLKPNTTVPVLGKDSKDSTNDKNSKHATKKTKNMKTSDMGYDFTDFLGKPPRTLKQRKKLAKIVKTISQNNKKNVDFFDDTSEDHENSRVEWDDFIDLSDCATFNIGEETPRSKLLHGSCLKTPETSPSRSIFQITPCNSGEVLRYVHQQKTKKDRAVEKKDAKKTKLSFIHTTTENQAANDIYAALLKEETIPKHIITKAMNVDSDDSSSESFD
ncbi:uncharacterized protein LOC126174866 isoform X2 [Schistocerca cancellata]|uniref:uncharacterized protein LOC126174866 isoform X2 n=1 Tax=Schistocerca cancellata TaxID=274614 RepID=UPI0021184827|nr:uncharacterized protein LOC126174866 isoform X2 [Schistocerca cancellata]